MTRILTDGTHFFAREVAGMKAGRDVSKYAQKSCVWEMKAQRRGFFRKLRMTAFTMEMVERRL
jgi:hypothetical protein